LDRLLGFDPQLLFDSFITGINVFILFFALSYKLFNPVRDYLEKRKLKIAGELKSAAEDKEAAHVMKEEYEARLLEVRKEAEEILDVTYAGAEMEIGFNVSYVLDVLNALKCENVRILLTDSVSSVQIEDAASQSAAYVVMPMRL